MCSLQMIVAIRMRIKIGIVAFGAVTGSRHCIDGHGAIGVVANRAAVMDKIAVAVKGDTGAGARCCCMAVDTIGGAVNRCRVINGLVVVEILTVTGGTVAAASRYG